MRFFGFFIFHAFMKGVCLRSAGYIARFMSMAMILEGWKDSVITIEYPQVHLMGDILGTVWRVIPDGSRSESVV